MKVHMRLRGATTATASTGATGVGSVGRAEIVVIRRNFVIETFRVVRDCDRPEPAGSNRYGPTRRGFT
ncbi:hypothetical protein GCM10027067_26850 [Pseudactinotalea suaedae]